ncbi:hypothetical protein HYPSUDRAFT_215079 [Hypholoma sublateritium FD-334 SS-4]|uniref:RING-type domain-containing protein n=1 Tax=Hypholoma sublateritium (strain FD-334 SS-4) TaxID=945553 RepID=A0A0D2PVB3_HYPSF|nr:hypothetical protein HYPSUDRAFT_215079 [Hypholoma sublateritium FD-334 SS-4]
MPLQCSICLCTLKEPMCLPCGHIYCKNCLSDHVNVHTNPGMTSTCPDCRATFNLGIPDLTYLPTKYHKYIMSAARRVYIDNAEQSALEKRLEDAERRLESKKMGEEALLTRCEGLQKALFVHRTGEAKVQKILLKAQEKLHSDEVKHRETVAQLVAQIDRMEIDNIKLAMSCDELTAKAEDLEIRVQELQESAAD